MWENLTYAEAQNSLLIFNRLLLISIRQVDPPFR